MKQSLFAFMSLIVLPSLLLAEVDFPKLSKKIPTSTATKHSFCYEDPKTGSFAGENLEQKVRLASTSKIVTANWTINKLGPYFRFKTTFYYDSTTKALHIEGTRDPFMGKRKLFFILSELNNRGIFELDRVTFSKDFSFFTDVEAHSTIATTIASQGPISASTIVKSLTAGMNTASWKQSTWDEYVSMYKTADKYGIKMRSKLSMKVKSVSPALVLPLKNYVTFSHSSVPLYRYLKEMNKYSMNYPADEFFRFLGGPKEFEKYAKETLDLTTSEIKMYTGSGLPFFGSKRFDNDATCGTMVYIVQSLFDSIEETSKATSNSVPQLHLQDIMMVAGVDPGTLGGYYQGEQLRGGIVAKTGTINTAVSLVGYQNTNEGELFFGIFFQPPSPAYTASARNVRDRIMSELAKNHEGLSPVAYKPKAFFVIDKEAYLKDEDRNVLP